ncbi:TPA: DotI/IcmL family type IV secretion protein [Legionella feeleii]
MKGNQLARMLLIGFLVFPPLNYAANIDVSTWTQKVLLATLTIDYNIKLPDDMAEVRKNYSPNAWEGLQAFLGDKIDLVRKEKLSLHPVPVGPPMIVTSGVNSGIIFWRINQVISVPELNAVIEFSVIVSLADPYLIQTVSMIKGKV